jgi:hypothetical protein
MREKAQIERSLRPPQSSLKGSLPKAAKDACRADRGFLQLPGYWQFHFMASP